MTARPPTDTGDHEAPSQTEKAEMAKARHLIKAGRYQEAAEILKSIDHPIAREWSRKLHDKLNVGTSKSKHKPPLKQGHSIPAYEPEIIKTLPMCARCRREINVALADCTHQQTGQCPYRVEKRETGTIWLFVIGMIFLVGTVILLLQIMQDPQFDPNTELPIFLILMTFSLAFTAYGALVFFHGRQLTLSSPHSGRLTHTQTVFGRKTEIDYPLMIVEAPHNPPNSDLPISVLMWCFSGTQKLRKEERVFVGRHDDSIVYLTVVGLMLRGVVQLYARYSTKTIESTKKERGKFTFYLTLIPDGYTPRGTLEDNLLAVLPPDGKPNTFLDLKTFIENAARYAGCDIYRLVHRTVDRDVKALGLNDRLGVVGAALSGINFIFGDSVDKIDSIKAVAGEFMPKRKAVMTAEELESQLHGIADEYYGFEEGHFDLLEALYRQIDSIIESDRPDAASN